MENDIVSCVHYSWRDKNGPRVNCENTEKLRKKKGYSNNDTAVNSYAFLKSCFHLFYIVRFHCEQVSGKINDDDDIFMILQPNQEKL